MGGVDVKRVAVFVALKMAEGAGLVMLYFVAAILGFYVQPWVGIGDRYPWYGLDNSMLGFGSLSLAVLGGDIVVRCVMANWEWSRSICDSRKGKP